MDFWLRAKELLTSSNRMTEVLRRRGAQPPTPHTATTVIDMHALLAATRLPLATARLVSGFSPIILAEMTASPSAASPSETYSSSYWFLDRQGTVFARALSEVPDYILCQMRDTLALACAAAAQGLPQALHRLAAEFFSLDRRFRLELMRRLFQDGTLAPLSLLSRPLLGNDLDLPRLVVEHGDGGVSLVLDGLLEFPILMNGRVVQHFVPGWRPSCVVSCFAPLLIIELRHDEGARASWVLDQRLERIDDAGLTVPEITTRIRAVAPSLIRRHWQRLFELQDDRPDAELDALLRLGPITLRRIVLLCSDQICPRVEDMVLDKMPDALLLPLRASQNRDFVLPRDAVEMAVRRDLYVAALAGLTDRRFVWPSPVDGSDAQLEAIYPLQEHSILYQFRDRNGLRFIVVTADRDCNAIGIFFPTANLAIGRAAPPDQLFSGLIGGGLWINLLSHCLTRHEMMSGRRRTSDARIVNVFMALPHLHIGHYVWNDLSGQLALVQDVPCALPTSIIMGAAQGQSEFLGPIEKLFPALAGRVDRALPDKESFVRWSHESGYVPVRFTKNFVSIELRDAVRSAVEKTEEYRCVVEEIDRSYRNRPIFIIGIRLDDRTFIDNTSFYTGFLEHVRQIYPDAVLVFDGRNAKPGGAPGEMIGAMKDAISTREPAQAEQVLVDHLAQLFQGTGLAIIGTIGQPVQTSMSWCYHAQLSVALWGAGLAKYRWLANLPSLILTSRFNLVHRHDLDIYQSDRFMEAPSLVLYPDPTFVTDHIDKVGLSDSGMRVGRECFEIDIDHTCSRFDQLAALTNSP